jgi:DNA-binding response OmpR family regulator
MKQKRDPYVLVVEDDTSTASTLGLALDLEGIRHRWAPSVEIAILECKSDQPACVLLDYLLQGHGAEPVIQTLRNIDPSIPIILVTAMPQSDDLASLLKVKLLKKPFDLDSLVLSLRRYCH